MLDALKLVYEEKRIWVTLGGNVLIAFMLALVIIALDTRLIPTVELISPVFLTSVNLAKDILSLLAGSLFSVATFTFGTMLAVISFYSSNFSPRTVENFLLHKAPMQALGVFLGGFIYCLSSLFFMRNSEHEYLVLSATVALIYALFSVLFFVRFVYSVAMFVRMEQLVDRLYHEADESFDKAVAFFSEKPTVQHLPEFDRLHVYTIQATQDGYVEYINFDRMVTLAQEWEGSLVLYVRIGDFVARNKPLGILYTNKKIDAIEKIAEPFNRALVFEIAPSTMYDPIFARTKLVEVALRAVSPGINDPNSAIHILQYKALLDGKMAALPGRFVLLGEHEDNEDYTGVVFYDFNNFAKDLYESYWQLIHYMKQDISGASALFDSLLTVAYAAHPEKLSFIKSYSTHVYQLTTPNFPEEMDQRRLTERYEEIMAMKE
ncbi:MULTISPECIES: DUF2254 domain-containing protein [unclassified Jeotgalibaca]|uniref:DUF2254 domain-containing protein n=1 Tax=unclassified Jeotgalibaca TaxID=2621505 RepID=UPI003FD55FC2